MNSSYWQMLSYISLIIGILLFLAAAFLALKFKVISIIAYERKARKKNYNKSDDASENEVKTDPREFFISQNYAGNTVIPANNNSVQNSGGEDDMTVVLGRKNSVSDEGTVIIGQQRGGTPQGNISDDFAIVKNIIVTSADFSEINKW